MKPTEHGQNIADQIQEYDAFGADDALNITDLWLILDSLHSHFIDTNNDKLINLVSKWMHDLEDFNEDLTTE